MTTAKVLVSKVRKACDEYLNCRQKCIDMIREDLIQKKMNGWIFKRTREEAITKLKSSDGILMFSEWERPEFQGSYWSSHVESIQRLANSTNEALMDISPSDAELLGL